jgi:hypothetical protein
MTADLSRLSCTCGARGVDRYTACATCRAWSNVRMAIEHIAAMARRGSRGRAHRRLEQRVRSIEDALAANGIE